MTAGNPSSSLKPRLEVVGTPRPADPSGKAGQIAAELERRLILGEYHFDEPLSVTEIARQFDSSRQPVMAAIAHLRTSGFVEIFPQSGCRVVAPSKSEISDFFVALGKLEATAALLGSRRYEGDEADSLIEIASAQYPDTLNTARARQAYIDGVFAFYDRLWDIARSPALHLRVVGLRRLATFYLWQGLARMQPPSAHLLIMERIDIAAAVKARDPVRAEILMEKHVSHKPHIIGVV